MAHLMVSVLDRNGEDPWFDTTTIIMIILPLVQLLFVLIIIIITTNLHLLSAI